MSLSMEDPSAKEQSSASGRSTSKLLRYPLRSATRAKEEKPPLADSTNSASKRGRAASSVSKSVNVLDLSVKEKSAKPPRRLSVPSKSNASPAAKSFGTITPISEARAKRNGVNHGKSSDTPLSDVSRSSNNRKKFSVLSSASYWLSQIKLSESAAKHSISLGFFKLALEAGCEPIQRMSDELKMYARNHNLSELGETVKEVFDSYKISENFESSQGSETCPQVPAEGNQLSDNDDDANSSSSSITDAEKLKPKSLDINAVKKTTRPVRKNAAISKAAPEVKGRSVQKKPQKPTKQDKEKVKKQANKSAPEEGDVSDSFSDFFYIPKLLICIHFISSHVYYCRSS
ncbi:hypothetical protein MIMGU_mgv1a009366mg [Erythranthe guttata]|uniref:Uncharacterized protein n=1 Tax=Erythranthe guttata TaxID=4155 RepID=A0A022R5M3_ERYGU|nr:hypothetical protein MIMGU_mgv1a009366mg [Erythranthe guttata]